MVVFELIFQRLSHKQQHGAGRLFKLIPFWGREKTFETWISLIFRFGSLEKFHFNGIFSQFVVVSNFRVFAFSVHSASSGKVNR